MKFAPGACTIKLFWSKFTHSLLKAIFLQDRKIMVTLRKWSSLQKA